MKPELINRYITPSRMNSYNGISEYEDNLLYSRRHYVPLAILEVALRNSIHSFLSVKVGPDWLDNNRFLCRDAQRKINEAKSKLTYRHEPLSIDKIIAELNFGFWVGLFTQPYETNLRYNDLKKVFPSLPSKKVELITRRMILTKLHTVKTFRNRLFHYEKVINKPEYLNIEHTIFDLLNYFDPELAHFARELNQR